MPHELIAQDICVGAPPSDQAAVDCVPGWTTRLPVNAKTGFAGLYDDARVSWAIERLGGVAGKRVLELGPLEAGHTWMLEQAGAAEITAIEANRRCYMRCLVAKELMGIKRARFLLGDFMPWLLEEKRRFDVVWAAGVLYHMAEPILLLQRIAAVTERVYIYTHYMPDDVRPDELWARSIVREETRLRGRQWVRHYVKSYEDMGGQPIYCGGVYQTASWLRKEDILLHLKLLGFTHIDINMDVRDHQNGPCMNLVASRYPLHG